MKIEWPNRFSFYSLIKRTGQTECARQEYKAAGFVDNVLFHYRSVTFHL